MKYDIEISKSAFDEYQKRVTNQIYKLLPMREENQEWQKFLTMLMYEMKGLDRVAGEQFNFIPLVAKLESLFEIEDFTLYRKTIFECLGLINKFVYE